MKKLIPTLALLVALSVPVLAGDIPGSGLTAPPPPPPPAPTVGVTIINLLLSLIRL